MNTLAKARRDDPITSHRASDSMNKLGRLHYQQVEVLRALKRHSGLTAKQLGHVMANKLPGRYGWAWRRMRELESMGFVERFCHKNDSREMRCFITDKGREALL